MKPEITDPAPRCPCGHGPEHHDAGWCYSPDCDSRCFDRVVGSPPVPPSPPPPEAPKPLADLYAEMKRTRAAYRFAVRMATGPEATRADDQKAESAMHIADDAERELESALKATDARLQQAHAAGVAEGIERGRREVLTEIAQRRENFHATYNGGWHGNEDGMRAFHHGMDTVFNALDRALGRDQEGKTP